ncbi:MAG: DUF3108 domain-containing protein [Alcanivoracaceae bacterium]|nr:DUF3108 domain-containing protein [Alcanivoracaceae bacterium]
MTALLCLCGLSSAETLRLKPAEAAYRVVISGVPVGMEALISLGLETDGRYLLAFNIDHALLKHEEVSRFRWHNCSARPEQYHYRSSGFGIRRGGTVTFDWPALSADGDTPYPLTPDSVDAMTLAMISRCYLAAGVTEFEFKVAEPAGLRLFRYRVVGEETLETPAGVFDTIKVERLYNSRRRTFMWAARDLEFFMVRMDHIENALVRGRIEMTRFSWGQPALITEARQTPATTAND